MKNTVKGAGLPQSLDELKNSRMASYFWSRTAFYGEHFFEYGKVSSFADSQRCAAVRHSYVLQHFISRNLATMLYDLVLTHLASMLLLGNFQ